MKKAGVVFTIIGAILLLLIIFVTIFLNYTNDYPVTYSSVYYGVWIIALLCLIAAGSCLNYKRLQEWSVRIEAALDARAAKKKSAPIAKPKKRKASPPVLPPLQLPRIPQNAMRTQRIQSLYLCEGIHPVVKASHAMGILMFVGSLASIPIVVNILPFDYMLAYAAVGTALFWGGIIVWAVQMRNITQQKMSGFALTMDGFLYHFDIDKRIYRDDNVPLTQIGKIIYYSNKNEEVNKLESKQEEFLNSTNAKEEIEECLNGNTIRGLFNIIRMDAPHICKRNISNIHVKFWNADNKRIERIALFKNNGGFERILSTIDRLDQGINYTILEKRMRNG